MRILDAPFFLILSLLLGWFSVHIFVRANWSQLFKACFAVGVGVLLFVVFGAIRLTTGEQVSDLAEEVLLCRVYTFPHCKHDDLQLGSASNNNLVSLPATDPKAIELTYWEAASHANNVASYEAYLKKYPRGEFASIARVNIRVLREASQHEQKPPTLPSPMAEMPPSTAPTYPVVVVERLGMTIAGIDDASRSRFRLASNLHGVVVTGIAADGPAAGKGMQPGDVIVELANQPVYQPQDVANLVEAANAVGRTGMQMLVNRNGSSASFVLTFGSRASGTSSQITPPKCVRFNGQTICG